MLEQCELEKISGNIIKDHIDGDNSRILTVKQFCSAYPWPSESAMRSYIYRAGELGISDAFVRVRRRVLVLPSKFFVLIKKLESCSNKGSFNETTQSQTRRARV